MIIKLVIFIPSRIYGGAERQMALLAQQAADDGYHVTLIDSPARIVLDMIKHRSDITARIYDGKHRLKLTDSVVVMQASYAFSLSSMLNLVRCDVRFWFMHPLNLPHMYLSSRFGNLLGGIFRFLLARSYRRSISSNRHAMYFQSDDTRQSVERFYRVSLERNLTGLMSEMRAVQPGDPDELCSDPIEICWLGRLDLGSKLLVIEKLLYDFSESDHFNRIACFHIVGDGPAKRKLADYAESLGISDQVFFHGHVPYEILPKLLKRFLVVFAHGTSVYEAVLCHVPVSVVDFYSNFKQVSRIKYRLYSDDSDPTLGYLITGDNDPRIGVGRSFDSLISGLNSPIDVLKVSTKQLEKYEVSRKSGADRCRKLYSAPFSFDYRKQDKLLDVMFFSFRKLLLRLRK